MERVKWTEKNAVVLERVREGRTMMELIRKRERNLAGPLAKKELPAEGCSEGMVSNGKKVRGRRRYQMIDNIMINGLYEDTKRKAEKRVEWRMLSFSERRALGQNTMIH